LRRRARPGAGSVVGNRESRRARRRRRAHRPGRARGAAQQMTDQGYEILSLDDLERAPQRGGGEMLRPLRRRLGFRAFGVNAWSAETAGDKLIPPHEEESGHEELYVVVRGAARFTLGEEAFDAPAGTLIRVKAGTFRTATAAEADTMILVAGATPGEAFV